MEKAPERVLFQCKMQNCGEGLLRRKEVFRRVRKQKSSLVTFFQESNALAASNKTMRNSQFAEPLSQNLRFCQLPFQGSRDGGSSYGALQRNRGELVLKRESSVRRFYVDFPREVFLASPERRGGTA